MIIKTIVEKKWMRKGSTLIEALLLIFVYNMAVVTLVGLMQQYYMREPDLYEIQDLLSVHQLETLFLTAILKEVNSFEVELVIGKELFYLEEVNNKIILSPGTQIYFLDLEHSSFEKEGDKLLINFERNNKEKKYEIRLFRS